MSTKTLKPNKNPLWETNKSERSSYYLYFFGQNMIYCVVATFLTTYLAFLGIPLWKSSIVLGAVKVWDAVNDALFGVIFDKVNFKSGKKFIPWLKIACALTPVATLLLFNIPNLASGENAKLILFAIVYIVWDTAYTFCDVPAFGIITSMTGNIEERNTILSLKGITGGIGSALTTVLATTLVSDDVGLPFGVVALIIAVVAMATMFPICYKCEERIVSTDEEQFTVKKMIKYLFSNKYLLLYYIGYVFFSGAQTYNSLHLIFSYYIFENELISLVTGTVAAIPQLIMTLLVPKMMRKIDKMKLFKISVVAAIVTSLIILPTKNVTGELFGLDLRLILFALTYMLRAIPLGIIGVLAFLFTPDCAEYGQYTTGTEAKGITFAIQTFAVKLAAALSSAVGLALLDVFKFKEIAANSFKDLEAVNAIAQQPASAIDGIWFTYNIFPIIGLTIACAIWFGYKLNDKDVQLMADCNNGRISREEAESKLSRKY